MADIPEHDHIIDTGKSKLTLEELGAVQPGMARVMPEVGQRIWKCFYAGKAHNKPLARFQLKEAVNLMEMGVLLRPKYTDNMYKFIEEQVEKVKQAIENEDWGRDFPDLRTVLLHVITETAVHAGHLDAVREMIDTRQWIVQ